MFFSFKYLSVLVIASLFLLLGACQQETFEKGQLSIIEGLKPADQYFVGRNYPNIGEGDISYKKAVSQALKTIKKRNNNTPWTIEGPHNIGGRINCIAIHSTNANIIYIGTPAAGIFKTTNGGTTWTQQFINQGSMAIGALVINPLNPNILYAGTGDKALSSFTYLGRGLYKSTDGGNTWTNLGLENTGVISKIVVNPNDTQQIFVGTAGNIYTQDNNRGVYKSNDGGITWTNTLYLGPTSGIGDLIMHPTNPSILFATGRNRFRSSLISIVNGPAARIYRSIDGGTTWDTLTNGLPQGPQGKITLAIAKNNPSIVYANYCDTTMNYSGFYKSTNGGNSWQFVSQDPQMSLGGFGWYFGEIRVDPNNDNKIYWMGVDLFVSNDGGDNWQLNAPEWWQYDVHADKHDLQFISSNSYLLATDGGLYKTTTSGGNSAGSWNYISQIPITQFYRVAYNQFSPNDYFGGAQDNGSLQGNATGLSVWQRYFGGDGFKPIFHPQDPSIFFTQTQNGYVHVTYDGGNNYDPMTSIIADVERCNWNSPYKLSSHNPNHMYFCSYRVHKTTDIQFPAFTPISNDLTNGTANIHHTISAFDESPLQQGKLFVGTSDARIWTTQNDGSSWTQINTSLPSRYVSSIKASPNNPNAVFVSYWGYRDNDTTAYIYYSDNNGSTWTNIAGNGLPQFAINSIWVLPGGNDSSLLVANDGGVYQTADRGTTWSRVGNNMPIIPVFELDYNPTTKRIMAGTFAMSLQTIPLDSLFITKPLVNASVGNTSISATISISPNPAHDVIYIIQSSQQLTTATLYDLNANKVANIVLSKPGKYSINTSHLAEGIYIVLLKQGQQTHTQKIVVKH